jgi:hypothetical protein
MGQVTDRGRLPQTRLPAWLRVHLPALHQERRGRLVSRRWSVPWLAEVAQGIQAARPMLRQRAFPCGCVPPARAPEDA